MAENDRPLPNPPRTRFGRQIRGEEESAGPMTADRLAQAAAEGRLEDVLQHEIPEGEHARNLAMMMLGMSGMTAAPPGSTEVSSMPGGTGSAVPPEVLAATMQADVAGLMSMLRAEHARRSGEGSVEDEAPSAVPPSAAATDPAAAPRAGIDQALVDELIRIAAENQVTVDWLLLRAVKLYLEEHRQTGRL